LPISLDPIPCPRCDTPQDPAAGRCPGCGYSWRRALLNRLLAPVATILAALVVVEALRPAHREPRRRLLAPRRVAPGGARAASLVLRAPRRRRCGPVRHRAGTRILRPVLGAVLHVGAAPTRRRYPVGAVVTLGWPTGAAVDVPLAETLRAHFAAEADLAAFTA